MGGQRRKARAIALQVLYELDSGRHTIESVLERFLAEAALSEENNGFVRETVGQVIANKDKLDGYIKRFATAWPLEQTPVIDRNILRLAIFEILFDNKVSVKIAINEAVELAKRFGSDSSPKFINGVLGSVSALTKDESQLKGR